MIMTGLPELLLVLLLLFDESKVGFMCLTWYTKECFVTWICLHICTLKSHRFSVGSGYRLSGISVKCTNMNVDPFE